MKVYKIYKQDKTGNESDVLYCKDIVKAMEVYNTLLRKCFPVVDKWETDPFEIKIAKRNANAEEIVIEEIEVYKSILFLCTGEI